MGQPPQRRLVVVFVLWILGSIAALRGLSYAASGFMDGVEFDFSPWMVLKRAWTDATEPAGLTASIVFLSCARYKGRDVR